MSPHVSYRNSSLAFRTEQAFLIASAAMDVISPLTFLAFAGHAETQRMQEASVLEIKPTVRSGRI